METTLHIPETLVATIADSTAMKWIAEAMRFRAEMTLQHHANRMSQWWAITRTFYLSWQQFLASISLELDDAHTDCNNVAIQRCEQIRAKVDGVLADDGGHCRHLAWASELPWFLQSHDKVHYLMFHDDIARPLRDAVCWAHIPLSQPTLDLMRGMSDGFGKTTEKAFAWILVVEIIAENIVTKMLPYLTKIQKDGKPFFSKEQLFYCTYHILLEKLHAGDVTSIIREVADTPERMQALSSEIILAIKLFALYWLSLADIGKCVE